MTEGARLEPCPFCGSPDVAHGQFSTHGGLSVACMGCCTKGPPTENVPEVCMNMRPFIDEAHRLWNTRASRPSLDTSDEHLSICSKGFGPISECPVCAPDTSDAVEVVARAIAYVIAKRHAADGREPSEDEVDSWHNDVRRDEARAAISSLATIRAGVVEELCAAIKLRERPEPTKDGGYTEGFNNGLMEAQTIVRRLADREKSGG